MEYQKEALIFVLREDLIDWVVNPINDSAAMVFEETASRINPRVQTLGLTGRLSFLKVRHRFGSHTKTLNPIVPRTRK